MMRFGINLGGGNLPEEPRAAALAGRLEKARLASALGTIPCGPVRAT